MELISIERDIFKDIVFSLLKKERKNNSKIIKTPFNTKIVWRMWALISFPLQNLLYRCHMFFFFESSFCFLLKVSVKFLLAMCSWYDLCDHTVLAPFLFCFCSHLELNGVHLANLQELVHHLSKQDLSFCGVDLILTYFLYYDCTTVKVIFSWTFSCLVLKEYINIIAYNNLAAYLE